MFPGSVGFAFLPIPQKKNIKKTAVCRYLKIEDCTRSHHYDYVSPPWWHTPYRTRPRSPCPWGSPNWPWPSNLAPADTVKVKDTACNVYINRTSQS